MTARTDAQGRHERFAGAVLELDIDYCSNIYGVAPCTAGRKDSGTAQAGASSSITLRAAASSVTDFYKNMTVHTTGGTGSGQDRVVTAYNGTTKVATVDSAWGTNPNNTTTYDVIDRPNACYNTFLSPCQDKANYIKGTKTFKFCNRGMRIPAGEFMRPYIETISVAPTEIDPKQGIARSSKTTVTLTDEPATDYEADKYYASRSTPAGSTFFARFLARNPNYVGRWARLRLGYVVDPWDWNTFQTELYVIDAIKLGSRGQVTITLKDPIKLADRAKVPAPSQGKLLSGITNAALSLSVDSGKGPQYGSSGYVRVGDEVIQFGSRLSDTLTALTRGQFGTTAAAHSANDKVQLCKVYSAAALTDVIKSLLNDAGISNTYIDTTQMAAEDTRWLSTKYQITVCLTEPEAPSTYIGELCREANAMLWWHPVEQKLKFKVNMPESATATIKEFNETAHIIRDSLQFDLLEDERTTTSVLAYALKSPVANRSQPDSYLRGAVNDDTDASSANEFGDRRISIMRSRFLGTANDLAAGAFVSRDVSSRRNTPGKLACKLDPKDYTIAVGELVDLNVSPVVDAAGVNKVIRVRVVKLKDMGSHIEIECRTTKFKSRYAFVAPNATPDYPTDTVYAHICRNAGAPSQTMTNGDDPYLII